MNKPRYYNNAYRDVLRNKISLIKGRVFSRDDITDDNLNREQLRLNRVLHVFMDEGSIIKIAHGLFAKAEPMHFPDGKVKVVLTDSFESVAMEALNKLGVKWELGSAIRDYNEGKTTQVPSVFTVRLKAGFVVQSQGRVGRCYLRKVEMPGELNEQQIRKTAIHLGLPADFIRKDYFVTKAIRQLTTIKNDYFELIFQGGTSLYQGSVSKLSAVQLNELDAHLEQNTYLTVEAIIAYVYEQYDVTYSVSGMTDLLHRLKFTYKKSKLVPAKADKKKQEVFLKQLEALMIFLPSYSPNLNLIERLWKFMKKKVLYNKYYEKFDTLKEMTLEFFENIQQYKPELDSLLSNHFHLLNAS